MCEPCPSILRQDEGPNTVIPRPIEFAHISLPYDSTTMGILETGGYNIRREGTLASRTTISADQEEVLGAH